MGLDGFIHLPLPAVTNPAGAVAGPPYVPKLLPSKLLPPFVRSIVALPPTLTAIAYCEFT